MTHEFKNDSCLCANPSVATMDHIKGFREDAENIINRCCTKCSTHWYGKLGDVKKYTKNEWDKWIESAFDN